MEQSDGQDEAVVLLGQRGHINGRAEDSPLFVFTLRAGRPVALPVPELEGLITEINIKDGSLVVEHGDLLHGGPVHLRNFRWTGSAFEEVDNPIVPDSKTHYLVRLFGCDDGCSMKINGDKFEYLSTAFAEDSGWIDFTEALQSGRNTLKFEVNNEGGGGIAYSIRVRKNDSMIFEKICGRAGQIGCENNRVFPKGIAREFTYTMVK